MTTLQAPTLFYYYLLSNENRINSLTASQDGYIYGAGFISENFMGQAYAGGSDAFIVKYDTTGKLIWARLIGASGYDEARAITVAKDGSIYIAGVTSTSLNGESSSGEKDAFITKYSSSGTRLWTKLIGTASGDSANSINVDVNGNVYVGGYKADGTIGFISSYKSNGDINWTQQLIGDQSGVKYPEYYSGGIVREIKTISDGSIYLVGDVVGTLFGQTAAGGRDSFLIKMNPNGTQAWTQVFGSIDWETARGVDVGSDGTVYVVSYTNGSTEGGVNAGFVDIVISKYDSNGNLLWNRQTGAAGNDYPEDIAVGSDGNIYITGYTNSDYLYGVQNKAWTSAFLLGYSPNGERLSVNLLAGEPRDTDTYGNALTSFSGGLILSGTTSSDLFFGKNKLDSSSELSDSFLVKFAYASSVEAQPLILKNIIFSNDLSTLYQLLNNSYAIDVAGFSAGDSLSNPLVLSKGTKPFSTFKGSVKSLIDYGDGSYGVISLSGTSWIEQKFSATGLAQGKAVKLITVQLLSKEVIAQQDINGDGSIGEVVATVLDGDGDAAQQGKGLYKSLVGTVVIGAAGLETNDLVGSGTALMSSAKKAWIIPKEATVEGIAFTDGGNLEVLTRKGTVFSAQKFDDLTGLAITKAIKLTPEQIQSREYYYGLDLNEDGEISLVGQELPPAGWVV